MHLDGARVFNALIAKSESSYEYGKLFDTISVCLSKGLGAPIGSVLIGNSQFINEAKRVRKSLGGGMRQVGYLAAAGQYALKHHVNRLADDHNRAKVIGECLISISCVENIRPIETNLVLFDVQHAHIQKFNKLLHDANVKASFMGNRTVRFVTHLGFSDNQLEILLKTLKELC